MESVQPALVPCPGECSGRAGQNRCQCLLLLLTEIWLFTENQGEKRGSSGSGQCVRAACRVTGVEWDDPAAALQPCDLVQPGKELGKGGGTS